MAVDGDEVDEFEAVKPGLDGARREVGGEALPLGG